MDLSRRLDQALSGPIDWIKITDLPEWDLNVLEYDWTYVFCKHTPNNEPEEYRDYLSWGQIDDSDHEEIEHVIDVLLQAKPLAIRDYMKRAGRFADVRTLTPSEHGKHFVAGLTFEQVKARSLSGPSLFFKDYRSGDLEKQFWLWFFGVFENFRGYNSYKRLADLGSNRKGQRRVGWLWHELITLHQKRVCMQFGISIGATAGTETSYMALDMHLDTRTFHVYPVSRIEAARIM